MDIKTIVLNQLNDTNGLYSLMLQNHLYGCFILMEDIAQNAFNVSGTVLSTPKFSFDYDKQFSDIGIRFGFVMDTKLCFSTFHPEYKDAWLRQFKEIDSKRDIAVVDSIEDCITDVIKLAVKPNDAFFVNALETGSLPQEWIETFLTLLVSTIPTDDVEIEKTAISVAITEKPLIKHKLSTTRRASKPRRFKTRRNH
jgi:hypothetical protein